MRTAIVSLIATCIAMPCAAQNGSPSFYASPAEAMSYRLNGPGYHFLGSTDTPRTQQQKIDRALALKAEALRLQAQDGGTLSPRNRAYLQRKADAILAR